MEDFIRLELLKKPRPKADAIFFSLMDYVEENNMPAPGEAAVIKRITKLRKEVDQQPPSELDTPWTIGASIAYGIPPDMIPVLFEVITAPEDGIALTIREARWLSTIYNVAKPLIEQEAPGQPLQQFGYLYMMANQYAQRERIAELKGKLPPDTSELDRLYFIDGDLDIIEGEFSTYLPEMHKEAQQALENFNPLPIESLESRLGKLTKEQVDLFNEWLYIIHLGQVHPRRGKDAQEKLFKQHPDLIPLTQAWMKWSVESQKGGYKNARLNNQTVRE